MPYIRDISKKIIILIICYLLIANNSLLANNMIIVKDVEIESFIKSIMAPIFKSANVNEKSINIYLVNNPNLNAFVFNGQNIFIHTGLITAVDSIDEIAGVLSHELGHITAGHLSRGEIAYSKANIFVLLSMAAFLLATPFLGSNSNFVDVIGFLTYGTNQIATTNLLTYSRAEESQADEIGMEYMYKTYYNPKGFSTFMNKLYAKENKEIYENEIYSWYSTHPLTKNRISFVENYIKNNPFNESQNINHMVLQNNLPRIQGKILAFTLSYDSFMNIYGKNNNPSALYGKMIAEYKEKNHQKAIYYANKLLEQNKNDYFVHDILGDIYYGKNDFKNALNNYLLSINSDNNDDIMPLKVSRTYLALNNNQEALKYINISIQINNANPYAWHLKSMILSKLNMDNFANIAMANKFLLLQNKQKALFFINKTLMNTKKDTQEYKEANDLLKRINDY